MGVPKDPGKIEEAIERALCGTSAELHLQQYPVFCLAPRKPSDTRMTFSETIRENGAVLRREWSVYIQSDHGWPGEHEAEVWRSIEHIVHLRHVAGTFRNPIDTSFSEIRKHMSGKGRGGRNIQRIKDALSCLASTKIATSFFYQSVEQIRTGLEFNLIASISYKSRILANGQQVVDSVWIELPEKLCENIKNRYVRPIDKGFRDGLGKWVAKRLYELLGIKFHALQRKKEPYRTRYSRLCGLLGITRQQYLSRARQVLSRAHQELERQQFISRVEWFPTRDEKHDWVLAYWPGSRARAEWSKEFWRGAQALEPLLVETLPETESEPAWVEELAPDETDVSMRRNFDALASSRLPPEPSDARPGEEARGRAADPQLSLWAPAGPDPDDAEDAYARAALEAFERGTGKARKLARITTAERKRLRQWQELGVAAVDIAEGAGEALKAQTERAREAGKVAREIVSLAFVHGYVLEAAAKRQRLDELERKSLERARASQQGTALPEAEEKVKEELREALGATTFETYFAQAVLVQGGEGYLVLLGPIEAFIEVMTTWRGFVEERLEQTVFFMWSVEWAFGPGWRQYL